MNVSEGVAGTLRAEDHGHPPAVMAAGFCTEHSAKSRSIGYEDETAPTLRAGVVPAAIALEHHPTDSRIGIDGGDAIQTLTGRMGTGGNNVPLIMVPEGPLIPYTLKIRCGKEGGGKGALVQEDKPATFATNNDQTLFAPAASGITAGLKAYPIEGNGQRPSHLGDGWNDSDAMYTLNATEQHGVAYGIDRAAFNMGQNAKFGFSIEEELEPTLVANGPNAVAHPIYTTSHASHHTQASEGIAYAIVATDSKDPPTIAEYQSYVVRRITPLECERLQGFPDNWTLIGDLGEDGQYYYTDTNGKRKKVSDGARFKALGNSIALPFWQWLARRITAQYERDITMGSLFDGIGGFPYVFERCGATAVWASEIEEFPIAVTKLRFPEDES